MAEVTDAGGGSLTNHAVQQNSVANVLNKWDEGVQGSPRVKVCEIVSYKGIQSKGI